MDWLIDRLIVWLIDWLIDRSVDWLVAWLVDWLIGWSIDWLIDWLISSLLDFDFLIKFVKVFGYFFLLTLNNDVCFIGVASFTIIASEFPEAISTIFGACETFNGLGYTLGPPIGGYLFQLGGFKMPFFIPGCAVCLCGLVSWLIFPTFEDTVRTSDLSYRKYFSIPGVWVSLVSVFAATLGKQLPQICRHSSFFHFPNKNVTFWSFRPWISRRDVRTTPRAGMVCGL